MFKSVVKIFSFLLFAVVIYAESQKLPLAYYIFPLFLIFPLFYFYHSGDKRSLIVAGLLIAVFLLLKIRHLPAGSWLYLLGYPFVFGLLIFYRRLWSTTLLRQETLVRRNQGELETLRQKYNVRVESLKRLEKQVSSLVELFEVARDFSECLSFDPLVKLLREKVRPELPFFEMEFVLIHSHGETFEMDRYFVIREDVAAEKAAEDSQASLRDLRKAYDIRQLVKIPLETAINDNKEKWIFPLNMENKVAGFLTVVGANTDDLVRFEVLAANLVLQVKKILLYETVKELSIIDGLTGVYVRRHFLERFKEELQRSLKFKLPLAVLMLDIDHFKRYNDEFGHLVGDATLREVAEILRRSLRKVDVVARYGGEEFIAVLPETAGPSASEVAERIRSGIARHRFRVYDVETQVTVSLGISLFPADVKSETIEKYSAELSSELIQFADKALYRAKEEGRNRVYRYQDL